jgi:hypothetical protein
VSSTVSATLLVKDSAGVGGSEPATPWRPPARALGDPTAAASAAAPTAPATCLFRRECLHDCPIPITEVTPPKGARSNPRRKVPPFGVRAFGVVERSATWRRRPRQARSRRHPTRWRQRHPPRQCL